MDYSNWRDRANEAIAHGALTNSKRAASFVDGVYPTHLVRGEGVYVWDSEGKRYTDYIGANGTNLFGYGHPIIGSAIRRQFSQGALMSLGTVAEVRAAERVKSVVPFIERLRFLKTGSEACSAACTIARAATGRDLILSEGYHGWHQEFTSLTPPRHGIPANMELSIDKLAGLEAITESVAAVIVEPVQLDYSKARIKWLHDLRDRCTKTGTVLIFDEIITGFRFPKYCVAAWSGVTPDLILLGKAIGGGLPLAIVGGKRAIMEADYFVSSTFAGETLSLAACEASIDLLQKTPIDTLWNHGQQWLDKFNAQAPELVRVEGYPTRGAFKGEPLAIALFWQEACGAGVLFGASWFYSFPHIDLNTFDTLESILWKIKHQPPRLKGLPPQSPFANRARSQ